MNSNDNEITFMDQLNDAIAFLYENKSKVDDEANKLYINLDSLKRNLKNVDNSISDIVNSMDKNYELFSPKRTSDKNVQIDMLEKEKSVLENQINESIKKLESFQIYQNNLLYSVNCLEMLKNSNGNLNENKSIFGLNILETQENERNRIAKDLHDSTVQNLTNIMHKTELCTRLIDIDIIRAKLELQTMINTIKSTINDMRVIIYDLRPMSIDDLGLISTIERFIREYNKTKEVKIVLNLMSGEVDILSVIRLTLFRIIQEAVNNAIKHGNAKNIIINFYCDEEIIKLDICDDGCGFEQSNLKNSDNSNILSGFGLPIMKERVLLLSGEIKIDSNENGTKIFVKVPLKNNKEVF